MLLRSNRISLSDFSFNFNGISNRDCLPLFLFEKRDIQRVMNVNAWPVSQTRTSTNRYAVNWLLVCWVLLRRLPTPSRWNDLEDFFGKHASQLSEIFWEGLEWVLSTSGYPISVGLSDEFMQLRALLYTSKKREKLNGLSNCVGFINGTFIG